MNRPNDLAEVLAGAIPDRERRRVPASQRRGRVASGPLDHIDWRHELDDDPGDPEDDDFKRFDEDDYTADRLDDAALRASLDWLEAKT